MFSARKTGILPSAYALSASAILLLVACGGRQGAAPRGQVFDERLGALFDNGVDFVGEPSELGGKWQSEWEAEAAERIDASDAVLVVRIETVRTDTDLERRRTYRFLSSKGRVLTGSYGADEVTLRSTEGDAGFVRVASSEKRILGQQFVAFLKWERQAGGLPPALRWHLSPATAGVLNSIGEIVGFNRGTRTAAGQQKVITHD